MSLEGAKLICLDEAGNHGEIVLAKGRRFTMGYYMNCDVVLTEECTKGVHCEIECDAFGRVTIRNLSPDKPILLNGSPVEIKRLLLNNSKISILGKDYLWVFPKCSKNEIDDLPEEAQSTPQKHIGNAEQPPNSCPDFKLHRCVEKRLTVHNFAYCIQSDEEGNVSSEINDDNSNKDSKIQPKQLSPKDSENVQHDKDGNKLEEDQNLNRTPDLNDEVAPSAKPLETPKLNLIHCTKDKENITTQKKNKQMLTVCQQSDLLITSFSPRQTGVKIEKTFAAIIKPKVMITKSPLTPKSVYCTPSTDSYLNDEDNENERDLMAFHTPSTSKKGIGNITGSAKVLKSSSMHLIDLTTPTQLRPATPYLKSASKSSTKKNFKHISNKSCVKLISEDQLGVTVLPATPIIEVNSSPLETPPSVISVSSSTDVSSVEEVTNDGSSMTRTLSGTTGLSTQVRTPKKTPQPLIKRAILRNAKNQSTTPQISKQNRTTPRNNMQLPRKQSLSAPTRKSISVVGKYFDNFPSTSHLTSALTPLRRSTLNPISAAKALPTSTPVSCSKYNSSSRVTCRTPHLRNMHKSFNVTSVKQKSPQQVMSNRLVTKARFSSSTKLRNMDALKNTSLLTKPRANIFKDEITQPHRQPVCKSVFSAGNQPVDSRGVDDLSRTFIISDEENVESKELREKILNTTFSPEKVENSSEKWNLRESKAVQPTIEMPLDVDEIPEYSKERKECECPHKNRSNIDENNPSFVDVGIGEEKSNIKELANEMNNIKNNTHNKIKYVVAEENFAEIINEFKELSDAEVTNHISNYPKESWLKESQESFDKDLKEIINEEHKKKSTEDLLNTSNQGTNLKSDLEIGFGEESIVEIPQTSFRKTVQHESTSNEDILNKLGHSEKPVQEQQTCPASNQCIKPEKTAVAVVTQLIEIDLTKNVDEEIDAQDLKQVSQKTCEYKLIVEDVTLESSSIENESTENKEIAENKKLLNVDNVSEDMVKSRQLKETEVLPESVENDSLKANFEVAEIFAPTENQQQQSGEHILSIPLTNTNTLASNKDDNMEDIGVTDTSVNKLEECEKNQIHEDNDIFETSQQSQETQMSSDRCQLSEEVDFDKSVGDATNNSVVIEAHLSTSDENIIDSEDTNKLLEEIEDVLNKSDEMKQKMDLEKSENPLNHFDLESKQLSEENNKQPEEIISISSEDKNMEVVKEVSKLTKDSHGVEYENKNQVSSQEQENSKTVSPQYEEQNINISKIQTKEFSNNHPTKRNEEDNNVSQSEMTDSYGQERLETKETESVNLCGQNSNTLAPENIITQAATLVETELAQHKVMTLNQMVTNRVDNKQDNFTNEEITKGNISLTKSEEQQSISKYENNFSNIEKDTFVAQEIEPKDHHENTTRNSQSEEISSHEPAANFDVTCQSPDTKSVANPITEHHTTESLQNLNLEAGELKVTNTKTENITTFTPRRSTRRVSQSTADTLQPLVELSFTPRRSTRRASLSVESPTMSTPAKRVTSRRASFSVETPITTPKKISKRRPSISLDNDEISTPSTSKALRSKKNSNQLEQRTVIPEEINEIVSAVIMEEEEESALGKQLQLKYEAPKEAANCKATTTTSREKLELKVLEEKIHPANQSFLKNTNESTSLDSEISNFETHMSENKRESAEAAATTDAIHFDGEQVEDRVGGEAKLTEIPQDTQEIVIDVTLEKTVTKEVSNPSPTNEEEVINKQAADISEAKADPVQCNIVQDAINENPEKSESKLLKALNNNQLPAIDVMLPDAVCGGPVNTKLTETVGEQGVGKPSEGQDVVAGSAKASNDENVRDKADNVQIATADRMELPAKEMPKTTSRNKEQNNEFSTSIIKESIDVLQNSPKTPLMAGIRDLLKTPKTKVNTPQLGGLSDLLQTPKNVLETAEEFSKLTTNSELLKTPSKNIDGASHPKDKQHISIVVESPQTPLMTGMRELLQSPKAEMLTPEMSGISNLVQTPKLNVENEREVMGNLTVIDDLTKTPQNCKSSANSIEKFATSSKGNEDLKGVKELLKTPKICSTPRFRGIRELMKTPKISSTPIMRGMQELLKSPASQDHPLENLASNKMNVEKEPTQSPKDSKNLHRQRIRDLMQTPNSNSSPVKQKQKEQELEKFLRTPRAKNIMIPSMPSSAVIEKSDDSIEVSTEYDLNATHEDVKTNLEEIFQTSMAASNFAECITDSSYYNQQEADPIETDEKINELKSKTLQDTLNKSAEESFDQLVGQETYIKTPPRKIYVRKPIGLQTPHSQSPFTAADVLSDLPKTDIEEWIETLDEAEPPILTDIEDNDKQEQTPQQSTKDVKEASWLEYSSTKNVQNMSVNDSVVPETCTKVYLTENSLTNNTLQNIDPLSITNTESKEDETCRLGTTADPEISGINFLDLSLESEQEELSVLEGPLAVEEPSMLEEPLTVSDNESVTEKTLNRTGNRDNSQDEGNDLSEPLLLSESEDLNLSFETPTKTKRKTKEAEETETSNFCINFVEEKPNSYTFDPLETEDKGSSNVISEEDNKTVVAREATSNNRNESLSVTELVQSLDEQQLADAVTPKETHTKTEQRFPSDEEAEILEEVTKEVSEEILASTSQTNKRERESGSLELNIKMESVFAEIRNEEKSQIEIKDDIKQTKVEFVIVDNSATEICEETNINEEHGEHEKNIETQKKKDEGECEDIFMDNSNIDESFADEAISEEHEAVATATGEVTSKTPAKNQSAGALFSIEAADSEIEIISDTEEVVFIKETNVSVNEVIEIEKVSEILQEIEMPESRKLDDALVTENSECDQISKENIVSELFVKSCEENKCEQLLETQFSSLEVKKELPRQMETKACENVVVTELEFSDEKHLEKKEANKYLIVEPTEHLIEKENEAESATANQQEPTNSVDDVVKQKAVRKLSDIPRIEITHDTATSNENLMENSLEEESSVTEKQLESAAQEITPLKESIVTLTSTQEIVTCDFESVHLKGPEVEASYKLTEDCAEGSKAKEFKLQTDQAGDHGEHSAVLESKRISAKVEGIDTKFQRDEDEELNKSIEETLEEVVEEIAHHKETLKDMIPDVSQQDKIPKRKRTTSESSQESVKDDYKKSRRGGRRRENKNQAEIIVVEECEEPLLQELMHQEQEQKVETELKKTEHQEKQNSKLDNQIYLPEETPDKGQNIAEGPVTTQEKQTKDLHKAEELSTKEKETAFEVLTKQFEIIEQSVSSTVELAPEEEESSFILKIGTTENITVTLTSIEAVDTTKIEKVSAETQEGNTEEIKLQNLVLQPDVSTESTLIALDEQQKPVATVEDVEISQTADDGTIESTVEKLEEVLLSIDSESIQSKLQEEGKVRNILTEKRIKDKSVERALGPASSIQIADGNLAEESSSMEAKPFLVEQTTSIVSTHGEQLHEVQSSILKDQTQKRNRHKANVSETNQGTDDTSRTRRGRRRIKKASNEEILVEEIEKEKTNEQLISADSKESSQKKLNDKDVSLKTNEAEQISSVNARNEENSGTDIEVAKIESKEYRQERILGATRMETSEHAQGLSETVQMPENEETEKVREHKFDFKETIPEASTTNRARSRDVKVSITEALKAESNEKFVTSCKDQEAEEVHVVATTSKQQEREEIELITNKQTGKPEQQNLKDDEPSNEQGIPIIEVFPTPNTKSTLNIPNDKTVIESETEDKVPGSLESASEQECTEKERHTDEHTTKPTKTRGRRRKAEVEEVSIKKNASRNTRRAAKQKASDSETHTVPPKIRSSNRVRKTPVEHLTTVEPYLSILHQKPTEIVDEIVTDGGLTTIDLSEVDSRNQNCEAPIEFKTASTQEQPIEKEMVGILADPDDKLHKEEEKVATEKRVKRTRLGSKSGQEISVYEKPVRRRAQNQSTIIEKPKENDVELTDVKYASKHVEKSEDIQDHDEVEVIEISEKPTKRRGSSVIHKEPYSAESSTKSKRKRAGNVESENQTHTENTEEPMKRTDHILLPGINIDVESEKQLEQKALPQKSNENEAKVEKGGRKHIEIEHKECGPSSKRRVGRRKKGEENEKLEKGQHNVADKQQQINTETTENTSSEHKEIDDNEKQIMERIKNDKESVNTGSSGNAATKPNEITNKHDLKEHDDHVSAETEHPRQEIKKGRALRKKRDQPEEHEEPTKTISPKLEHRGRRRKGPKSETPHDLIRRSENHDVEKLSNESENKAEVPSEEQIPQRPASVTRKGRTAIEHITAESQEVEVTPGRRARNVPQRRAATAYHNYDETSDTEVVTKTKKKTEPSTKPLEADKNLLAVPPITLAAPTLNSTPLMSFTATPTTARGRTRKPTAKVQQFLEEERAKAETPKKKALLAAAAVSIDGATPQRASTRRGRKALTVESEVDGTSQIVKGKGKDKLASASTKEESSVVPESTTVIEIKEVETHTTPPSVNVSKGRRGGRKAKITEEDHHDEPPAKKSPLELEMEKHVLEAPTPPTRVAGRRNAAAAAKARIEEDALAAAAIELPKKTKTKKATAKALVAAAAHSSEVEKEHATEIENLSKISTIDAVEDLEEETVNKATSKRGRKVATVTSSDSPALPLKRGRKPKIIVDEVADTETFEDSRTVRDRGKRRKNVHFDENHASEATSSSRQNETHSQPASSDNSEPTKKGKRTRRK